MKNLKTTLFSRGPRVLSSTLKLALGKDIQGVVEQFSELKGVPQKVGQLLSMDVSQYLPEEFKDKLKALQGEGKAMSADVMLAMINTELSREKFETVTDFDPIPLGAGSIGQVHRCQLGERTVVFKIQYPGLSQTVDADLALFKPVIKTYELFKPDVKDLSIVVEEARRMLKREMDYELELNNLLYFGSVLRDDNRFIIPEALPDYSGNRILCMDYINGKPLNQFIKTADNASRKKIAEALLELFIREFFEFGKVQTDPNFANYLITGEGKIVLLDFGAVLDFDNAFRERYFKLLHAAYQGDKKAIIEWGETFGLVSSRDQQKAVDLFVDFMIDVFSHFRHDKGEVDFKDQQMTTRLLDNGWKLWKEQRISSPDSQLVFLHRKIGGLFSLLKEMEVKIDLHQFWAMMSQSK